MAWHIVGGRGGFVPRVSSRLEVRLLLLDLVLARASLMMRRTSSAVTLALAEAVGVEVEVEVVGLSDWRMVLISFWRIS